MRATTIDRGPVRLVALLVIALVAAGCGRIPSLRAPEKTGDPAAPETAAARERPPVGVASRVFTDAEMHRELAVTVWYPTVPGTVEHDIEWDGIFVGHGAWNAPVRATRRRVPLVLLSHGSGGDASNLTWLAEALASHGYVVAAPDHPGDRFGDTSIEGRFAAWRRARDVRVVIDRLLTDATFGPCIDRNRIGAAGHSSGAYTVLALAGLRLEPNAYLKYCSARQPGPDCKAFVDLQPSRITDLAEASKSRRDPRIRAVLALAPVLGPAAIPASLRTITVPVVIVGSPADEIAPFELNAARYQRFIPRARLVAIPDAGHFVFMPTCTFPGKIVASQVCGDRGAVDRQSVHDQVAALARGFFDERLGRGRSAGRRRPVPGR